MKHSSATDNAAASNTAEDRTYAPAVIVCMCGFFSHMLFSDPFFNSIGWHYSGPGGAIYERFHPGTTLILISFLMLIFRNGQSLVNLTVIFKHYTVYASLLTLTVILGLYMGLRSGFGGLAFILDTHVTIAVIAIVLSHAPESLCRKTLCIFLTMALINSGIGIMESIGKFRIFTFNANWPVMSETYFRASAFLGHPLNNAMFTSVAIFTALALRIPLMLKTFLVTVFVVGLVAFGGRAGLVYSLSGLLFYGAMAMIAVIKSRRLGIMQIALMLAAAILVPVCLTGGIYVLLQSGMGERIATHFHWDESADSRLLAFYVFDFMTANDVIFGVSTERIYDIVYRMNQVIPLSDIENPWVLMLLNIGLLLYPFWLTAIVLFIGKLMSGQPLALKLAVLAYYVTASTSNSFGRKDSTYVIMVGAVICAATLLRGARHQREAS
jgi:polysaccharide biosynthesis protein VpsF